MRDSEILSYLSLNVVNNKLDVGQISLFRWFKLIDERNARNKHFLSQGDLLPSSLFHTYERFFWRHKTFFVKEFRP